MDFTKKCYIPHNRIAYIGEEDGVVDMIYNSGVRLRMTPCEGENFTSDALIAFWDGQSKGTKHMIDLAKENDLKIRICYYEK